MTRYSPSLAQSWTFFSTVTLFAAITLSWLLAVFNALLKKITGWKDVAFFNVFAFFVVPLVMIITAYIAIFITAKKSLKEHRRRSLKKVILKQSPSWFTWLRFCINQRSYMDMDISKRDSVARMRAPNVGCSWLNEPNIIYQTREQKKFNLFDGIQTLLYYILHGCIF